MIYITIFVLAIYILLCTTKEIPESLSATHYMWSRKWIFPAVMWFTGVTLLPYWLELTKDSNWQFLAFLACLGLMFIGCVPDFRNNEYKAHMFWAYIASLAAVLSTILISNNWYFLPLLLVFNTIGLWHEVKTKYVFIIELSILESVFITLLSK